MEKQKKGCWLTVALSLQVPPNFIICETDGPFQILVNLSPHFSIRNLGILGPSKSGLWFVVNE